MVFSDSHCHLDSYLPGELAIVFAQMKAANVDIVLSVSINLETSVEAVRIAQSHDSVLAAVGIHPGEAVPLTKDVRKHLDELVGSKRVAAVGEIGLDYAHGRVDQEMQKELFKYQLSLAKDVHLPVNIHHSPDAHRDVIDIIKGEKNAGLRGIVHGFKGNNVELRDWLGLGFYVSLGSDSLGLWESLFSSRSSLTDEVVRAIPLEYLLTETDSMARMSVSRWKLSHDTPPGNGVADAEVEKFRQPSDVIDVVKKIAIITGRTVEDIAIATTANLKRILKV